MPVQFQRNNFTGVAHTLMTTPWISLNNQYKLGLWHWEVITLAVITHP